MKKILILFLTGGLMSSAFANLSITFTGPAFSDPNVKTLFSEYLADYTASSINLFESMADCFAITNTTQPVFGEGYRNFAIGATAGVGVTAPPSAGAGSAGFGDVGIGATAAPFVTLSLDPLYSILGLGIFEDADLTFKILPLTIKPYKNWKFKFFNLGIILRKRVVSPVTLVPVLLSFEGISVAVGGFYSNNKITNDNISVDESESVTYEEEAVSGTVTGTIHGVALNVKTKSFSFDTEVKAYVNILYILDLFAGFGATLNFSNSFEVQVNIPVDVTVTVTTPVNTTESSSGSIVITGEDSGKTFIPRAVVGLQLNIGPIKIPLQGAFLLGTENRAYALTTGVTISF